MRPKIFSFFSGAGFLDLGFESAGFEVVFVNEHHKAFLNGYRHARKALGHAELEYEFSSCSITDYLTEEPRRKELDFWIQDARKDGSLVGFIGGPPCPDFSVGGKNQGSD